MAESLPFWFALAVSVLAAALCALYIRFSGPIVASQLLREVVTEMQALQHEWAAEKVALHRLAEEVAADVEKLETLRKRVSAAKGALERRQANGEEPAPDSIDAVKARLRAQGVQL